MTPEPMRKEPELLTLLRPPRVFRYLRQLLHRGLHAWTGGREEHSHNGLLMPATPRSTDPHALLLLRIIYLLKQIENYAVDIFLPIAYPVEAR